MSVINNMLRDLDARRVDPGSDAALPQEVLAAPRGRSRKKTRLGVLIAPVLLAVIVLGTLYFWPQPNVRAPQPMAIADISATPVQAPVPEELSSVGTASVTPPEPMRTETPPLALAMAKAAPVVAQPAIHNVDQPERTSLPREAKAESKPLSRPVAARAAAPRPVELPVVQSLPLAAPVAVVSATTANNAPNNASIRLEQSTQTPQERNLLEVQRAAELQRRGALVEAETSLRGVLDNDKSMLSARLALVSLLSRQQRNDEARKLLKDGVEIAPTQAQLLLPYARLLAARGEWRPAHEVLVPATDVLAQDAEYRALCGAVLQRLGQFAQASAEYRAALRLVPAAGAWWVGLGLSLEGDARPVEARNAYLQARGNALTPDLAQFVENKLARLGPVDQSLQ